MSMHHRTIALGGLTFLMAAGGCSTSTPIGVVTQAGAGGVTGTAGAGGAAGLAKQGPYVPSGAEVLNDQPFTNPSGLPADWVGYLENAPIDAVKLHFATDANGNQTLTVVRGVGTVPAPPTDPYQPWPVPLVDADGQSTGADPFPDPMPGFGFTARKVTWQGQRLRFVLVAAEPWAPWCGLQTSYPVRGPDGMINGYTCGRPTAGRAGTCTYLDDPKTTCDLNHEMMCGISKICACNATGCGASATLLMSYDITFFGDHATGTGEAHNVLLMPVAPSP
jgi:hypothetical protein